MGSKFINQLADAATPVLGTDLVPVSRSGTTLTKSTVDTLGTAVLEPHIEAPDPHPQYTTDGEAVALATAVSNAGIAAHVALSDPHPQYTTDAEVTAIATNTANNVFTARTVTGVTSVTFGAFPGGLLATTTVGTQPNLPANANITLSIFPTATADHSVDEQLVETPSLGVQSISAGSNFVIAARHTGPGMQYGAFTVAYRYTY